MKKKFDEVRIVLFDLDGTLIDGSETISTCVHYALDRVGVSANVDTPIESLIGSSLLDIFCNSFGMPEEQAEVAIFHYREHFDRLGQNGTRVYPGIRNVLSALQNAGFQLYIATVKPTSIAEKVLSDMQLRTYFDGVAGSSMNHERRDKADIIAHALHKHELDPLQSMMVGDRAQDITGAQDNGLFSVAVSYGFGTREELDAAGPDHMVDHSQEILELLNAR
jgi:phosphoglycolate phosphatase